MFRPIHAILLALMVTYPSPAPAQSSGPLRVYVFRTTDDASDQAVAEALRERGHSVTLGVRAAHLPYAEVRLADYHAVVLLGREGEELPASAVTALARYVQSSGGLLVDGPAVYLLRSAGSTLQLPATYCTYYQHEQTTYESSDPPDPVVNSGVGPSFTLSLTPLAYMTEQCLRLSTGARAFFSSRTEGERTARPAVVGAENGPNSRSLVFSVAMRQRELRNGDLRRAFVNAVEWVGAKSQPTEPAVTPIVPSRRNVYVLRSGDAASDDAVAAALKARGHQPNMGVRAAQLTPAVNLSGYQAVVALGAGGESLSAEIVRQLAAYVQNGGGLLVDGIMLYNLRGSFSDPLELPGTYCTYYQHEATRLAVIEPRNAMIHDGVAPSFDLALLPWNYMTEQCMRPAPGSKMLLYSSDSAELAGRPAMLAAERGKGRIITLPFGVHSREMREPNFQKLFVNSVEWLAPEGRVPDQIPQTPQKSRVYLLRSGDEPSDTAIVNALTERGHTVSRGVLTHQLSADTPLSDFKVVVAAGVNGQAMPAAAVTRLNTYLDSGGRLVLDGLLLYALRGRPADTLDLPADYCTYYQHESTNYERIDPPDPLLHVNIPASFRLPLSAWDYMTEQCLRPAEGAKLMVYSRREDEYPPRLGVVANEPRQNSKAVQFSAAFRQKELQNPDFRRLFVNAVEYAADVVVPLPPMRCSPDKLSFVFKTSADAPRSQTTLCTPTSLTPAAFTATASKGAEWLSVTPGVATTPSTLTVRVTPVLLAPGNYTGEITLASGVTTLPVPVTVSVAGTAPCTYEVSPLSASMPSTGGTSKIGVLTPPGCAWTAASDSPWISVVSGASGSGSGTVTFAASASTSLEARAGSLTVAGQSFSVAQAGTSLSFRLDPGRLELRVPEGTEEVQERIVSIFPSTSTPAFTAAGSTPWMTVAPASGTAPGGVQLSINPRGLAPGNYSAIVTIRIAGATPPEQSVPVALVVEPLRPPMFHVEHKSITLSTVQGGEPKAERVSVSNEGSGSFTFRAAVSDAPWLSVEPDNGTVTATTPVSMVLTGNPRGMEPGSYTGRVVVSSSTGDSSTIEVVMTVTAAQQSIVLSQTGLTFTAVSQGGTVLPQNVGVLNIGSGAMNWSAFASTLSGGPWLTISRASGSAVANSADVPLIDVGVNAANLPPGEYHGRITIASPTASNSPQIASVILQVLPPGSDPGPVVRPTGLIFITPAGAPSGAAQDVTISNPTSDARTFNSNQLTTDNTAWFSHSPRQATVSPTQPARISVQSSGSGQSTGVKRGVLTLLFTNGAVQTVNVLNVVTSQASASSSKGIRQAASCPSNRLVLAHTALRQDFSVATGQGVRIEVKASDTCGNLLIPRGGVGAFVGADFSTGDATVKLVHIGGGVWSGTWRPVRPAARMTLTITGINIEGSRQQWDQITISGTVRDSSRAPIVTAGGLQHAASFEEGIPIAPGTLITVKGSNLADEEGAGSSPPLPRELNGVEVLLGDRTLPLLYVSKGQLNVQIPFNLPANTQHQISVRRGDQLSVPETVTVTETIPGIFTANSTGSGQGAIRRAATGLIADRADPAVAGETVVIYCTGLGIVNPSVTAGDASPGSDPARVPASVEVTIGDRKAQVVFSGLTPGQVGLYEVHAIVPEGVAAGDDVRVTVAAGGRTSPPVTMAVR